MVKPKYKLYTPGPVDVPPEILKELSSGLVYHREASFAAIFESVRRGLQKLMLTNKGEVHLLTASGTGAMEAAVTNLVSPGDKVLVATAGRFGERWREINLRFGAFVDELNRPYGEAIPPEELERRLGCPVMVCEATPGGCYRALSALWRSLRRRSPKGLLAE